MEGDDPRQPCTSKDAVLPIRTLLNKNYSQINVVGYTLALTLRAALYSFFKPRIGAEHMKTSKSIPAGIAAFLVCVGVGCQKTPTVTAASPSALLEMETIPRTPARLTRGQYLVEGLLQCPFCHSDNDFKQRPARPVAGKKDGGADFGTFGLPKGNHIVASNISSDPEYGAGNWKDLDFVRALRQGIGHNGRTLFPLMP